MPSDRTKNFHLPLPVSLYDRLRQAARQERRPATVLARQAIDHWLVERRKKDLHQAVANYARRNAGGSDDLDLSLEAAATEHLLTQYSKDDWDEQP